MDEMETSFLKTQQLQPFFLLRYIDDILMSSEFHPNLKFTYETSQNSVNFLDLKRRKLKR